MIYVFSAPFSILSSTHLSTAADLRRLSWGMAVLRSRSLRPPQGGSGLEVVSARDDCKSKPLIG